MFTEIIKPRISETNAAGHIGFTVLPVWFEAAAEEVYRIFMSDLNPEVWSIIVAKLEMDCLKQIYPSKEVEIQTSILKIGETSFTLSQSLLQEGQLAAKAEITMVHFDYNIGKPSRIRNEHRKILSLHMLK